MPAKTPIYLKAATPRRGKKPPRLRDVLSGDMISPPLGDVRHSAHVGLEGEGDMFGDVRFLQGKMDMLPSPPRPPQNGHARSHSVEGCLDEETGGSRGHDPQGYAAYHSHRYRHTPAGLLATTISLPAFVAHEQAPPKPPRLHLDDPSPPFVPSPSQRSLFMPQPPAMPSTTTTQQQGTLSLVENGGVGRLASEPCRDVFLSPATRRYTPPPSSSSGSSSSEEASSEDSASEGCGPLEPLKGLSLDSDAGLSNEDLHSERSESPWASVVRPAAMTASDHAPSPPDAAGVPRSDSMAGLDLELDLGPSILDDVLGIMDRYKTLDDRWEL